MEYVLLAAWLLRQRAAGSESPWQPYVALLPAYVASPVTFPDHIVREFESPEFTQGVRKGEGEGEGDGGRGLSCG